MIRRADPIDAETIATWLSDPETNRFLTDNLRDVRLSPQLVRVALRRPDQAWYVFDNSSFSATNTPIGLIALDNIEETDRVANLWFVLGEKSLSRRGITSRAIVKFCEDNPLSLKVATAWAAGVNTASMHCLSRAGFDRIGEIPDAVTLKDGSQTTRVIFARALKQQQCGKQN